jgi:ubiquinone/menaquinone biosynthesis C-methylase UbiE
MAEKYAAGWEAAYAQNDTEGLWSEEAIPCVGQVVAFLHSAGVQTVVDVGCGDGRNLEKLTEAGFRTVGIDLAPSALARAVKRLRGRALLFRGDAITLDILPDRSVDAITCLDVFGQVADSIQMLNSFRRVLVPGGIVALNAFTPDDSEYGQGVEVGHHRYEYLGTLFKFFDETEIKALFSGWRLHSFEKQSWLDPPHGDFRPYVHRHDNWVVIASPPEGEES